MSLTSKLTSIHEQMQLNK